MNRHEPPPPPPRATLHRGLALLRCRDEGLLEELLLLPGFRRAVVRLLPPHGVLLDPADLDGLVDLLRERGYPPRRTRGSR